MKHSLHLALLLTLVSSACFESADQEDAPDAGRTPDAAEPEPGCEDGDGDGWGDGPDCAGPDCDDGDADHHDDCIACQDGDTGECYGGPPDTAGVGTCRGGVRVCTNGQWEPCAGAVEPRAEICDGIDDDCDGDTDDGVRSTCGDCDAACHLACAGVGCALAFEAGDGAVLTDEGAVGPRVGARDITRHVIWIPGGEGGAIYKIDTLTLEVLGAYAIDAPRAFRWRIVTDTWGNAFVAHDGAAERRVARIDADCMDSTGDGVLTTSSGRDDLLAPGKDDCMRWRSDLDLSFTSTIALGPDGRLWVALEDATVVPVDAETGERAGDGFEMPWVANAILPVPGGLWVGLSQSVCHVDTETLEVDCQGSPLRSFLELDLAADGALLSHAPLSRRDPVSGELTTLKEDIADFVVDSDGTLWAQPIAGEARPSEVYRHDELSGDFDLMDLEIASNHITADADGQLWSVSPFPGMAAVFDVRDAALRATLFDDCGGAGCLDPLDFDGDPAGLRLRRAFPDLFERAEAGVVLEATCGPAETRSWTGFGWAANGNPPLVMEVRAAPTRDALAIAPWSLRVKASPAIGTMSPALAFDPEDAFVAIRTRFRTDGGRLDRIDVRWRCE